MFKPVNKEKLDIKFILSRISEEDIFMKYMNIYPDLGHRYKNPLRDDSRPGCNFYRDGRGVLKFRDPAYRINIDCFNLVQLVHQDCEDFNQVLQKIAKDFNLFEKDIDYSVVANWKLAIENAGKKLSIIQVQRKDFTNEELRWWQEQGIYKEILSLYKVSSLRTLWLNGDAIYGWKRSDPGYVYHFGDYLYKAYFPARESYRFLQNIDKTTLQGYNQLPEEGRFLVITKSLKDVMCMNSFDIPAIAPTSETILISPEQFEELSNRFFYIFTLFDRDRAGMDMSWLMRKKYNTIPLLFESNNKLFRRKEEAKDFTDNFKKYGTSYMSELIEEIRQQYI